MTTLTVFFQERADGGMRSGIDLDGVTVGHYFRKGRGEPDPALNWYVDLRCRGPRLPRDLEGSRSWLVIHAPGIQSAFGKLADELRAGIDMDYMPIERPVPNPPRGIRMSVVASAVRSLSGQEIGSVLKRIGQDWERLIGQLTAARDWQLES